MQKLVEFTLGEGDLEPLVKVVCDQLALKYSSQAVKIYLWGELGAGKTFLVRSILRYLGLDPSVSVVSPTFGYMNEYEIGHKWYAHLDLYRMGADFDLDDLGIEELKHYEAAFIEWPDRAFQKWTADIEIRIAYVSTTQRLYSVLISQ